MFGNKSFVTKQKIKKACKFLRNLNKKLDNNKQLIS